MCPGEVCTYVSSLSPATAHSGKSGVSLRTPSPKESLGLVSEWLIDIGPPCITNGQPMVEIWRLGRHEFLEGQAVARSA